MKTMARGVDVTIPVSTKEMTAHFRSVFHYSEAETLAMALTNFAIVIKKQDDSDDRKMEAISLCLGCLFKTLVSIGDSVLVKTCQDLLKSRNIEVNLSLDHEITCVCEECTSSLDKH